MAEDFVDCDFYTSGCFSAYVRDNCAAPGGYYDLNSSASINYCFGSICGDGQLDVGEQCDDGNLADGDCCSMTCQYEVDGSMCTTDGNSCTADACNGSGTCVHEQAPLDASSCLVGAKAKLHLSDSATAGKDKLSWQWGAGEAFDQAVLGTPLAATTYTLCIYDTAAMVPSLEASIDIAASPTLWSSKDPKGLAYKDKAGVSDGVTKAQLKTGLDGKTKVKVSAAGTNLILPSAAGATFFNLSPKVVVQLVNSAGTCWTSEFDIDDTTTNEAVSFKAQVK